MTCIYQKDNVVLKMFDVSELDFGEFFNWSYNRPLDPKRITELKLFYEHNKTEFIPGIIYAWDYRRENCYYVYDGIHRLMAAKEYAQYKDDLSLKILIQFRKTDKEEDIVDDFININKNIFLPRMYIDALRGYRNFVKFYFPEKEKVAYVSNHRVFYK